MGSGADGGARLFREVAAGDRRALGRAITLVEGGAAGAREAGRSRSIGRHGPG